MKFLTLAYDNYEEFQSLFEQDLAIAYNILGVTDLDGILVDIDLFQYVLNAEFCEDLKSIFSLDTPQAIKKLIELEYTKDINEFACL
jgi:hypothetical protein